MLTAPTKALLQNVLADHTKAMKHARAVARTALGDDHLTTRILDRRVKNAQESERQLASEPAQQVA